MDDYIEVNPEDIASHMWNATWEVIFDPWPGAIVFRAAADCESDALDEVIDYLEEHDPEFLLEIAVSPEDFEAMDDDEIQRIEFAGNHSYPLDPDMEIAIRRVISHKYAHRYF